MDEGSVEVCTDTRCVTQKVLGGGVTDVVVLSEPDLGICFKDRPLRLVVTVYEASGLAVRTGTTRAARVYGECCGDWLSVDF